MTNNTTSYVNIETLVKLHNDSTAREYLAVIDASSASLVAALDLIDKGIIPSSMMYSNADPANIIELFDDGVARYKAISLYKRVVKTAIKKLIELGCINRVGNLFNKVSSGFSYGEQARCFLITYSAVK